jgi:hypothetical protein
MIAALALAVGLLGAPLVGGEAVGLGLKSPWTQSGLQVADGYKRPLAFRNGPGDEIANRTLVHLGKIVKEVANAAVQLESVNWLESRRVSENLGKRWPGVGDHGLSAQFISLPSQVQRSSEENYADASQGGTNDAAYDRNPKQRIGPFGHLLLGVQVLFGVLGIAASVYVGLRAIESFFDRHSITTTGLQAALSLGLCLGSGVVLIRALINAAF